MNFDFDSVSIDKDGDDEVFSISKPKHCSFCDVVGYPIFIHSFHILNETDINNRFFNEASLYWCTNCENFFLINSKFNHNQDLVESVYYPKSFKQNRVTSSFIKDNFPAFIKIFNQAEEAERLELDEICGMGFRKSLEFLIKDYCIYLFPEKIDSISNSTMAKCIEENIDSKRIKLLAKAISWLGNDECHYIKKNTDYNVNHIKSFISALLHYIECELSVEVATELIINSKQKSK